MKSLRLFLALSFVFVAFVGLARADERDKAAKPEACSCCCTQAKDKKCSDAATPCCCCCKEKGGQDEKVMPKSSYNRKS